MGVLKRFFLVVIVLGCLGVALSAYVIQQTEKGLLLEWGKLVTDSEGVVKIVEPGLHWRVPFATQVLTYDMRIQTLSVASARVLTKDQRSLIIIYNAKWQIVDLIKFYESVGGDFEVANRLLQQKMNDSVRSLLGQKAFSEILTGTGEDLKGLVEKEASALGIQVREIQIEQVDLPKEMNQAVYERMRAQQAEIAARYQSEGKKEADKIRAAVDAQTTITLATAKAQAAAIRADGVKQAAAIYAGAYNKNLDFYEFYRALRSYEKVMTTKNDVVLMGESTQFLKYFMNLNGQPQGLSQCGSLLTTQGGQLLGQLVGGK